MLFFANITSFNLRRVLIRYFGSLLIVLIAMFVAVSRVHALSSDKERLEQYLSDYYYQWIFTDDVINLFVKIGNYARPLLVTLPTDCKSSEKSQHNCISDTLFKIICQALDDKPSKGCMMPAYWQVVESKKQDLQKLKKASTEKSIFSGQNTTRLYLEKELDETHLSTVMASHLKTGLNDLSLVTSDKLLSFTIRSFYELHMLVLYDESIEWLGISVAQQHPNQLFIERMIEALINESSQSLITVEREHMRQLFEQLNWIWRDKYLYLGSLVIGIPIFYLLISKIWRGIVSLGFTG